MHLALPHLVLGGLRGFGPFGPLSGCGLWEVSPLLLQEAFEGHGGGPKLAQLHVTTTSRLEYGVWHRAAEAALQAQKEAVYTGSFQLGISLSYVFDELEAVWPMFPPTIGLRDIEKRFGWSRCTTTQLDPIALIQFNLIVSPERLQRNWLNVSVVAWANQMEPSQRPCTKRKLVKQSGVRIPLVQQQGWESAQWTLEPVGKSPPEPTAHQ